MLINNGANHAPTAEMVFVFQNGHTIAHNVPTYANLISLIAIQSAWA